LGKRETAIFWKGMQLFWGVGFGILILISNIIWLRNTKAFYLLIGVSIILGALPYVVSSIGISKRDEEVEFKILRNPVERSDVKGNKFFQYCKSVMIKGNDELVDKDGNAYPICSRFIKEHEIDESPIFESVEFLGENDGTISISGRQPNKFNIIRFLRCHNANKKNYLRDEYTAPMFEELEPQKTARQRVNERKRRVTVENSIYKLNDSEVVTYLKALKLPTFKSEEENLDQLITFIQDRNGLKKYENLAKDVRTPILYMIQVATDKEIISYNKDTHEWSMVSNGDIIHKVVPGKDYRNDLLDFFHNDQDGAAIREYIENEIEGEKSDAKRSTSRKRVKA